MGEIRGKGVYRVIEVKTKGEVGDGGREGWHWLVEIEPKGKVSKRGGEILKKYYKY